MAGGAGANGAARRDRLAQRRRALGLTQEDLASLLAVERSTVARWERGVADPLPPIRPRLAKVLRVSAERIESLLAADGSAGPGGTSPVVPRQLPAAAADFAGRAAELAALTRMLDEAAGTPGTVVISAIGGTAGVGKTALALYWAHQVADRFPAGQLHANLRGFDPSGAPASPESAVRGFLDALGVPADRIPTRPEAQAGLYRSLLADKRMLIVLDNARDEAQVRPLLPAAPGCLVLVTSRNQLSGLAAADGARLLSLDVLTHAEAVQLLTARIGVSRTAAEPDAVDEIAGLCACLPLALAVAAARAAARPAFPLAALATELRDAAGRLDALDDGDPAASVRAVFSWSYRQLSREAARMFRMLGVHPGPDISVPAAASLAAVDAAGARRLLRELARAHLVAEHAPGRYAFHDLLRAYAADRARDTDSVPDREAAIGRILDHYLHSASHACQAYLAVGVWGEQVVLAPPRPGVAPEQPADYRQAVAWFKAERQVLLAAVTLADSSGFDAHAWQLPWSMRFYWRTRGHGQEMTAIARAALTAATRLGDTLAQAISSSLLARSCWQLGDHDQALGHLDRSLRLYRRVGSRDGEAMIHQTLGVLAASQGRYADALRREEQVLRLWQDIGDKAANEAGALGNVGWYHAMLGNYDQARALCREAVARCAETGARFAESAVWDSLGYIEDHLGNFGEAAACYLRALAIIRDFGDRPNEAAALTHIGDMRHAAGEFPPAREAWQQALAIYEDIQHSGADQVRAKLASTGGWGSGVAMASAAGAPSYGTGRRSGGVTPEQCA